VDDRTDVLRQVLLLHPLNVHASAPVCRELRRSLISCAVRPQGIATAMPRARSRPNKDSLFSFIPHLANERAGVSLGHGSAYSPSAEPFDVGFGNRTRHRPHRLQLDDRSWPRRVMTIPSPVKARSISFESWFFASATV
jgi:hypothetical protein